MEHKNKNSSKEKNYTIYNLFSKLNKSESQIYGNYYLDYNEIFPKEEDYKDYFKKHVSLFNDDPVEKGENFGVSTNNFVLPKFFDKHDEGTYFYIFYFITRDTLQLHAGLRLYKKGWLYNYKYQIWFRPAKNDKWEYFNPLEWKIEEYTYGPVDKQHFLPEEDAKYYLKPPEDENKKENKSSKRKKDNNSSHQNMTKGNGQ